MEDWLVADHQGVNGQTGQEDCRKEHEFPGGLGRESLEPELPNRVDEREVGDDEGEIECPRIKNYGFQQDEDQNGNGYR